MEKTKLLQRTQNNPKPNPKPILKNLYAKTKTSNSNPTDKETEQSTRHPHNPIFISRPKCNPIVADLQPKKDKKFSTFYKIRLPKIQSTTPGQQEEEVTKTFKTVIEKL